MIDWILVALICIIVMLVVVLLAAAHSHRSMREELAQTRADLNQYVAREWEKLQIKP